MWKNVAICTFSLKIGPFSKVTHICSHYAIMIEKLLKIVWYNQIEQKLYPMHLVYGILWFFVAKSENMFFFGDKDVSHTHSHQHREHLIEITDK